MTEKCLINKIKSMILIINYIEKVNLEIIIDFFFKLLLSNLRNQVNTF